jgi:hypothetical protein
VRRFDVDSDCPSQHSHKVPDKLPGRRFDHVFFSATALLMVATVFVGFAPTYYLAGVFHAPLASLIIHLHGATFSCWILLLLTQTSLVSAGRADIHRRLGIAGFLLACLMVPLGVLVATDSLVRRVGSPGRDAQAFYIVPLTAMLIFATLIIFAFPRALQFVSRNVPRAGLLSYTFLLMLVAYDLWSTRKVHRATIWASAFLIFVETVRIPIGKTAVWHAFARWVQTKAG